MGHAFNNNSKRDIVPGSRIAPETQCLQKKTPGQMLNVSYVAYMETVRPIMAESPRVVLANPIWAKGASI